MKGERLGEFEEIVLLAVGVLGESASAVAVQALIRERADRKVSLGAVYGALDRLERKRFIVSAMREADAPGERRKRFFELTRVGRDALALARDVRESFWELMATAHDARRSDG